MEKLTIKEAQEQSKIQLIDFVKWHMSLPRGDKRMHELSPRTVVEEYYLEKQMKKDSFFYVRINQGHEHQANDLSSIARLIAENHAKVIDNPNITFWGSGNFIFSKSSWELKYIKGDYDTSD